MLLALYILIGLSFGSFLNVVIHRSPRTESVLSPRSYCPDCQARLQFIDIIPLLSYITLRGRCRICGSKISMRYPIVELLTAAGFSIAYIRFGTSFSMLAGCALISLLIVAAFTDLETGLIPNRITFPGIIAGVLFSFATVGWQSSLGGLLIFGGILFLTGFLSGGGMGGGDIKLGAAIGSFLGLKIGFLAFILAALLGGSWALALLVLGRADLKTSIKYGPFLALAAATAWLFGQNMLYYYFRLTGL